LAFSIKKLFSEKQCKPDELKLQLGQSNIMVLKEQLFACLPAIDSALVAMNQTEQI